MVQAVQNLPNPFIANVPPLAPPRTTPLAGDVRAFIPEPSAIVSLGAERPSGLVYNPDGTLDESAVLRVAPEFLLLQATGLSGTSAPGTATTLPLFPDPTPATLALALDEGFSPDSFDPVAALLGLPAANGPFIPGTLPEPAPVTAALSLAPELFPEPQAPTDTPTGTPAGALFTQPEPTAPPAPPASPTPPATPGITTPEAQTVPPVQTAAPATPQEPEPLQAEAEPPAPLVTAEAEQLLDTLATADAAQRTAAPTSTTPETTAMTSSLTEADELLAADLQALTAAEPEATVTASEQQEQASTPATNPTLASQAATTGVTPQQAANNPFAPAVAASLYLSAMSFRAQQSNSADLDNPATAVQPVGGVRAVSPTFFNREGPADDSRRRGM